MALRSIDKQFYFKYCEKGHLCYSTVGPITQKHCSICGKELIGNCPNCNSELPNIFYSPKLYSSGRPTRKPRREGFCYKCGVALPWQGLEEVVLSENIDKRKVFVVHGRNLVAKNSLFQFLRTIGLSPIEWSQATILSAKRAPFIGEILETAFSEAQAIVVLITGDDEAKLRNEFIGDNDLQYEKTLTPQARPNVLFEAGMAFGTHPERTILVELGETRPFSDIAGRNIIKLNNSSGRRQELAQRLESAGCLIDLSGTDWHSAGEFEKCVVSVNSSFNSDPIYKAPYYYKDGDEQPFCPICWETEKNLIHLDGPHDIPDEKPFYRCLKCKNNF